MSGLLKMKGVQALHLEADKFSITARVESLHYSLALPEASELSAWLESTFFKTKETYIPLVRNE